MPWWLQGQAELTVWSEVLPPFNLMPRSALTAAGDAVMGQLMRTLLPLFMNKCGALLRASSCPGDVPLLRRSPDGASFCGRAVVPAVSPRSLVGKQSCCMRRLKDDYLRWAGDDMYRTRRAAGRKSLPL